MTHADPPGSTGRPRPARKALGVAFLSFVMLGMIDASLGVAWPSMSGALGRGIADLGVLIFAGGVGYLLASSGFGWLHGRFGTGSLLVAGSCLAAVGLGGLALAPAWWLVVVSPLFIGLGAGLVDTGMNAHAASAFDLRVMNLLHACFGVGATLGPIVMTASLTTTGTWRAGYSILVVVQLIVAVGLWAMRHRWVTGAQEGAQGTPARRRRRSALLIAIFFLYTGVEFGTGYWAFTLLSEARGLATAVAGGWVAAYWAGLTIGRFGAGVVGHRVRPTTLLVGGSVLALSGLGLLWLDPGGLGVIGLPVAGLGLAPIFPTLVSVTPQRLGRQRSTHAIGYQLAAATLGGTILPWLTGSIAAAVGLGSLAWCLFGLAALLSVVVVVNEYEAANLAAAP